VGILVFEKHVFSLKIRTFALLNLGALALPQGNA
jgi:hypothetical protein